MENKSENKNPTNDHIESNNQNFKKIIIIQKYKNNRNQFQTNNNAVNNKVLNIDMNVDSDNVHTKSLVGFPKTNYINNENINLSNQITNNINLDYQQKISNPHPKIIIQKLAKKSNKNQTIATTSSKEQIPIITKLKSKENKKIIIKTNKELNKVLKAQIL